MASVAAGDPSVQTAFKLRHGHNQRVEAPNPSSWEWHYTTWSTYDHLWMAPDTRACCDVQGHLPNHGYSTSKQRW